MLITNLMLQKDHLELRNYYLFSWIIQDIFDRRAVGFGSRDTNISKKNNVKIVIKIYHEPIL